VQLAHAYWCRQHCSTHLSLARTDRQPVGAGHSATATIIQGMLQQVIEAPAGVFAPKLAITQPVKRHRRAGVGEGE
jgi:hypothetical protein